MLLLRPVLSRYCLSQSPSEAPFSSSSLQSRLVEQGALLCVSTAQAMIADLVQHQTNDGTIGLLPAWWYRVYYVYTAATVLIAARLRPEAFPVANLARSWAQAMAVLKAHESFRHSVRRCVAALHILSTKILQVAPEGRGESGGASRRHSGDAVNGLPHLGSELTTALSGLGGGQTDSQTQDMQFVDEFAPPAADLDGLDLAEFNFDIHDLSWLHDMHTAWELLNE